VPVFRCPQASAVGLPAREATAGTQAGKEATRHMAWMAEALGKLGGLGGGVPRQAVPSAELER